MSATLTTSPVDPGSDPAPSGWALAIAAAAVHPHHETVLGADERAAGFWIRTVAAVIDGIVLLITASLVAGVIFGIAGSIASASNAPRAVDVTLGVLGGLFALSIYWLYFALHESSKHRGTPAKQLFGLQVSRADDGGPLTFWQASGRFWVTWSVSYVLTCTVGFIMAAFQPRKQALHDMICGTVVTRAPKRSRTDRALRYAAPGTPPLS